MKINNIPTSYHISRAGLITQNVSGFKAANISTNPANTPLEKNPTKDKFQISVGYVNDAHGQTNNMMRVLSGLEGDIVLSAGDNDIGDEKNKAVHKVAYKFLNLGNIIATALGNHELDTTQQDLLDSLKDYKGDILTTNMKKEAIADQDKSEVESLGRADWDDVIKPSKIVEVKGEKIGLIGTAPIDLLDRLTHPLYHKDCHVDDLDDSIEDIQEEVDNLKEQGVNKIILLSHLGLKNDKEIAKQTDGIDVIIGGHTHELLNGIEEGDNLFYSKTGEPVIITQAGRDANYFGKLNLSFDKDGIITQAQNNLGQSSIFHKNLVNQYIFDEILGKPEKIGFIASAPLPPKSLVEENPHANFVCDVMKHEADADIAIWHNCGVRNSFHEGEINSRDIKDISPFLDLIVVANVSEKDIVDMFKQAINDTYSSAGHKPGLFAVSGLNYTINPQNGTLTEMNFIDKNGKEYKINVENPSETKKYKVVTDEFLMSAGADFKVLAEEKDWIQKFPYDKDIMVCNYIKRKNEPITINQTGRIKFLTEK